MEKRTGAAKKTRQKAKSSGGSNTKRIFLGVLIVICVMVVGVGCGFLTASMNTKDNLSDVKPPASSQIFDINGNEVATVHADENRVPVSIKQIPQELQDAFVAVEDVRFYEHSGIDPRGIFRALVANITSQGVAEGGSTITQQLAKNAYLTQERTMSRKIQEMFLALQLERQYTKKEILELYLNQIYFGQGAYGVQAAARVYFGKDVEELDLNECAMLAGIPKSPNYYSPLNNLEAAQSRKATVLDQMVKYDKISPDVAAKTKAMELNLVKHANESEGFASYFIDYVTQELVEEFGADSVYKEGLKVYTTLDVDYQKAAEAALANLPDMYTDSEGHVQPQAALVAIEPGTGEIRAMVGGRGTDQFNRACLAVRQPGSSFKPFVFAAALDSGKFSPSSIIEDKELNIAGWKPQNYDRSFNGKVSMRYVAEQSLNVATVYLAREVGIDEVLLKASDMGISTFVMNGSTNDRNLASSIGGLTRGVTPLEMTAAYGTFANRGVYVKPRAIIKVLDRNGKVLKETKIEDKAVLKQKTADDLTSMLMGVIARGTGTGANIGRPAAGKTGTTDDYHDAWFIGYVPDLVCGVWVGCDDNARMGTMTGGTTPATIWRAFMNKALQGTPAKSFAGASLVEVEAPVKDDDKDKKDKGGKDKKASGNDKKDQKNPAGGKSDGKPDAKTDAPPADNSPAEGQPAAAPPAVASKKSNE
ncbi:MAG: PBP1A family penicillin-binding protein [Selenomonadaceae bacterium]|nr:PBP1A family penicillin-binding protein [Selenomonadaceae bacterium]